MIFCYFYYSNHRMGSQCTCQREHFSSQGQLGTTITPTLTEKQQIIEQTDLQEEFDNPSRDRLNQNFLKTTIIASNNKLQLSQKHLQVGKLNQQIYEASPTQTSLKNIDASELSIGKNIERSESEQDKASQRIIQIQKLIQRHRKVSIQSKIPLLGQQLLQTEILQPPEDILKSISGYILSQKNLFEPIKIAKQNFVRFKNQNIYKDYKFLEKLGEGSFGKVYKVESKQSKEIRAAKVMKRSSITQQAHLKLMNEIDILRKVDHPNIIKIYEAYIFENVYCIITQYCQGGSLTKYIQYGRQFTDQSIRIIFRKLFSALSYMHKLNIVHRDIKLDNIVLVSKAGTQGDINSLDIRIIDFGLAKILSAKRIKDKEKTGTYTYMAPEVITGVYSTKCDIWSAGIALYSMIACTTPFKKPTKDRTFDNILKGQLQFPGQIWRQTNPYLKDLITKLLNKNINDRITASGALNHYFLRASKEGQSQQKIFQKVTKKFIQYQRGSNLISMIQSYISYTTITQKELQEFSSMFQVLDTNGDGVIQRKQLEAAFQKSGHSFSKNQIDYVLGKIDKNHNGKIDYSQFVTILSDRTKLHAKNSMVQAFKYIDINNDGFLEKEEIKAALKSIKCNELSSILMELDENNDNKISQEQFIKYMESEKAI